MANSAIVTDLLADIQPSPALVFVYELVGGSAVRGVGPAAQLWRGSQRSPLPLGVRVCAFQKQGWGEREIVSEREREK